MTMAHPFTVLIHSDTLRLLAADAEERGMHLQARIAEIVDEHYTKAEQPVGEQKVH
jgi:hypothetical protein